MKKLIIITAGSGSREVLLAIEEINRISPTWEILGFVDENPDLIGKEIDGYPVIDPKKQKITNDVYGICGNANGEIRERLSNEYIEKYKIDLATIIAPNVTIRKNFEVGPGSIIMPDVAISFDVKLGKGVFVLWKVLIAHHVRLGDYSTIFSCAKMTGKCTVGDFSTIGASSTINVGVNIGKNCFIGIGSLIYSDIIDNKRVITHPRQIIK
tara:strand:- start:805 stop:1437 length:633 start_codon:yes stop_codon:yes gene_type:complete